MFKLDTNKWDKFIIKSHWFYLIYDNYYSNVRIGWYRDHLILLKDKIINEIKQNNLD